MAIIRPARESGHNTKRDNVAKISSVVDTKKKKIEKKILEKQPAEVTPKKPKKVVKDINVPDKPKPVKKAVKKKPAVKKTFTPPKDLKTEKQWAEWMSGESIGDVSEWLGKLSPGDVGVELALALRTLSERLTKPTEALPEDHNGWLDYFSTMTRDETEEFIATHRLSNEARAAGERWLMIADNPALIDKIINSRLESSKESELADIMEAARSGDDLKLYEALRDNISYKIKTAGSRDMTTLIKQLNEVTTHLNSIYRERGLKDEQQSNIRKLLVNARQRARRPKQQAVQTISDYESNDSEDV